MRGRHESVEAVFSSLKHSYKRVQESNALDSAVHLGQIEPLYAIKPIYVGVIEAPVLSRVPIQSRITLISAVSLFGIGLIVLGWTERAGYSALLIATSSIVILGRMGTPDGFSSLVVLASLWAVSRSRLFVGILLLLVSVWIRTDNVLLVVAMLGYLLWEKRITLVDAGVFAALAIGSVLFINHFSGNYSWRVLFETSFLWGGSPGEVHPDFGLIQYLGVAARGAETILPQVAIWLLLAWGRGSWGHPPEDC